jgi:lipopolysaccharide export LptBFGC system permease protein LptF
MLLTLYSYVFRELLKTFGLTVLALTVLFTLGGGLYNAMRYEGVTAADLFYVLPMLVPIAITITMPVAALFAATMLYGRLAGDNELNACRAAGINIHRMFMPAMLLAVGVSIFSMFSMNLVIPRFMKEIEYYARRNVRDLAFNKLRHAGVVEYSPKSSSDRFFLSAQAVKNVSDGALIQGGFEPQGPYVKYFWIDVPQFLTIDGEERLKRYGVAKGALCMFDTRDDKVQLSLHVQHLQEFEDGKPTTTVEQQQFGPFPAPIPFPVRPGMVDLRTLRHWREAPWDYPDLQKELEWFLMHAKIYELYLAMGRELERGGQLRFTDGDERSYTVRADQVARGGDSLKLGDIEVRRTTPGSLQTERVVAPGGQLRTSRDFAGKLVAYLGLQGREGAAVLEYSSRTDDPSVPSRTDKWNSPELRIAAQWTAAPTPYTPNDVLDSHKEMVLDAGLAEGRTKLRDKAARLQRKVSGLIHFRLGLASSALVTILMGAALGVVFRGARALAAFGIACIPFGVAGMFILVGRQQIDSNAANMVGQTIIWGGLALIGAADIVLLRRGVQR